MDRYVGVDAHATSCTLAVMGPSGKRLKSMVVETNGAALVEAVKGIPGRVHLCLEEGTQSAWLHELFSPHVAELVVAVAAENKGAKDDLRDAWRERTSYGRDRYGRGCTRRRCTWRRCATRSVATASR